MEEASPPQSLCHLVPPALGQERSGCETPVSVDSIPLEWDHTGDVGGSSSHEDDEEGPFYSALSGKGGLPEPGTLTPLAVFLAPQQHGGGEPSGSRSRVRGWCRRVAGAGWWLSGFRPAHLFCPT